MVESFSTDLLPPIKVIGQSHIWNSNFGWIPEHGGNISPACFHGYLAITRVWPVYLVDKLSWVSYKGLFDRVAYGILSNINGGGATPRRYVECLWMIGLMVVMLMVFFQVWWVGVGVSSLGNWSYSKECVWNLRTKLCCNVPGKWNVVQIAHG